MISAPQARELIKWSVSDEDKESAWEMFYLAEHLATKYGSIIEFSVETSIRDQGPELLVGVISVDAQPRDLRFTIEMYESERTFIAYDEEMKILGVWPHTDEGEFEMLCDLFHDYDPFLAFSPFPDAVVWGVREILIPATPNRLTVTATRKGFLIEGLGIVSPETVEGLISPLRAKEKAAIAASQV